MDPAILKKMFEEAKEDWRRGKENAERLRREKEELERQLKEDTMDLQIMKQLMEEDGEEEEVYFRTLGIRFDREE